jgi:hypothetical protein
LTSLTRNKLCIMQRSRTATEVTLANRDWMTGFALGRREWLAAAGLALTLPALPAFATETEGQPWPHRADRQ